VRGPGPADRSKTLTVFHHRCVQEPGLDRYFFLLRLTNHSKGWVYMNLDGFTVEPADGKPKPGVPNAACRQPLHEVHRRHRAVAAHQGITGWITIDGTDGFRPAALVYTDGDEVLRVRFQGDWL